ncbi:DNA-processing protein DprA [Nocardia takedensis]|uniref:DNA-processing protein DprA n=1 Tax=Nocardia takedensis TaxID=259390 RepID=UPI00030C459B|nr:DNA-processing protein DprA [Nocardia takedensis]
MTIDAEGMAGGSTTADGVVRTVDLDRVEDRDPERRLAWVYLSRVVQGPCAPLSALIATVGVVEAARAVRECDLPASLRVPTAQRRDMDCAARDLETIEHSGGRVVTPDDPEWPAWRMAGLGRLDPGGDQDAAVPLVLWVRGNASLLTVTERSVAVVGARCSTGYGDRVTGEIVGDLSARGLTIVSGAAFGIDAAAHRAALAAGAATVAVLACGVDRPYPAQHDRLLAEIAENGAVVSEYPPGTTARKHQFLSRNRLIAALSDAVLVIEAGVRSGARNTVKWARRLGLPALATPGPVTSAVSVGCHRMIRDGEALLVTQAADILDETPLRLTDPATSATPDLPADQAAVYASLSIRDPHLPTALATRTGLALPSVRAALVGLELAGLVTMGSSGWHRTPRGAR